MENIKNYIAINASAGSGKTYTLVQRIIMICLLYPNSYQSIRNILALTFTNKAANEMKNRILDWLKGFSDENTYLENKDLESIKTVFAQKGMHISIKDLHQRSKKLLDYILHNYSVLNISTIDKFNAKLIRSFSYELNLPHQFNLEIDSTPYLIESVDKMIDEVGENQEISDAFMDFVNYNLDNEQRINLNQSLYKRAKKFINDIHYNKLKNNNIDWNSYTKIKNKLRTEISQHKENIKKIANDTLQILENKNLNPEDFSQGKNGLGNFFFKIKKFTNGNEGFPFPNNEEKFVETYRKGASSKSKHKQGEILEILDKLIENRQVIIIEYIQFEKKTKILSELLPLKINKEIQEKLDEIETENDLLLLSKFNILINEHLRKEPSNFIYEKIGTRFQHFFFDEFQDTSKMQWDNVLPLRDNAISSSENSFTLVGDPKQSIYRFRGGDSELMLNILNKKEKTPREVSVDILDKNYRSAKNIVNFNNDLYKSISNQLNTEHKDLFSEKAKQTPYKDFLGRVKVNFTPYSIENKSFYNDVVEKMHRDIQECLDNGFSLSDITILCRYTNEIQKFTQLLGGKKINYQEREQYIKIISDKGLTLELSYTLNALMAFFKWKIQPENHQYLIKMLYFLNILGKISIEDFTEDMLNILPEKQNNEQNPSYKKNAEKVQEEIIFKINERYSIDLEQKKMKNFNLYNYVEYYLNLFSVEKKETDFLLSFLETLYAFTQNIGATLKDFVKYWEEEAYNISIQTSENIDAVNIMTIHSSKGLEFPVVFLPMKNENKDKKFNEWLDIEEFNELKSVNLEKFNDKLAEYDEEIKTFNDKNYYKNKIDRLCVQYVATTRASQQLFLYIQEPSKSTNHLEIYDFLKQKRKDNEDSFDFFEENELQKEKEIIKNNKIKTLMVEAVAHTEKNLDNIRIATPSKSYQNRNESVKTGIFVHEVLEKIHSKKDVPRVLEQYLLEGKITVTEKNEILERLLNIIENEKYKPYFEEDLKIISEKEIMFSSEGETEIYRPDRIVETGNGYIIIDFKTGAENEKYETQIETYRHILEKIGKKVISTEIIYL